MTAPLPSSPGRDAARPDSPFGATTTRRRLAIGVVAAVALLGAAGAAAAMLTRGDDPDPPAGGHDHAAMAAGADEPQPVILSRDEAMRIGVTYAPVTIGALSREIRTVGQVVYDETRVRAITPKVDGWVERLYVDFTGQPVASGAPLFSLYSPQLVSAQEELLLARRLIQEVSAGTAEARAGAEELLRSARRRLAYWDVPAGEIERVERSGTVQRTLVMRSPVSGIVVEKQVLAGQRITSGQPVYTVADLGTVWVEGEIYEQDLRVVRVGLPVTATFDAFPGEEWRGRIAYVYPTVNPDTRTVRVRMTVPNAGLRLKPGMYATVRFAGAARTTALTVPRTAVLSTGERNLVFVRRADGRLEPHLVTLGVRTDDRIEVLSGLTAADTVVASATFLVDAESNLGTLMGGMGNMPGMDMTTPVSEGTTTTNAAPAGARER